ncbi:hypothetical protein [Streptomyces sp. HUAS ZL42]|uniref:hypothetical protein n=1 Tax=Streptomyces sp. HUAS ZL42 TaxID=3231715 RepID=UPI00345EE117
MATAATLADGGDRVSPLWLLIAYLLPAVGEVSFAPVGMSASTAIAPATFVSRMVALFWPAGALGGGFGGNALKIFGDRVPGPGYFLVLGAAALATGAALLLWRRSLIRRPGVGSGPRLQPSECGRNPSERPEWCHRAECLTVDHAKAGSHEPTQCRLPC